MVSLAERELRRAQARALDEARRIIDNVHSQIEAENDPELAADLALLFSTSFQLSNVIRKWLRKYTVSIRDMVRGVSDVRLKSFEDSE